MFSAYSNNYLMGDVLIDCSPDYNNEPANAKVGNPIFCVVTHEHCDHFGGIGKLNCEIAASQSCADILNRKNDRFGLCSLFSIPFPARKITRVLKEDDVVHGDLVALRVIETPGHAKGAICLYEEERKWLFSGDTVFPDMGMPRVDLPTSEPEKLRESYEKLAALDIRKIFPGHGEMIEEKEYVKKVMRLI
jgi:glyoxylase-like metal-dependent hydrolase (beta-lactamase superfamily II)